MSDALVCFILDRVFLASAILSAIFIVVGIVTFVIHATEGGAILKKGMITSIICAIVFTIAAFCIPQGSDYMRIKEANKPVIEQPKPKPAKPITPPKPAGSIEEI